jgi:glycosyltransferase involved in cell wall biosynthesis
MARLCIVLPCYNPQPDWAETIITACNNIQEKYANIVLDLHLVNDGSSKGVSSDDIERLQTALPSIHYHHYEINAGKGHALRMGVEKAQGEYIIVTDVDFPYEDAAILEIYNRLLAGEADVCLGVRREAYYKKIPIFRKHLSKAFKYMTRKVFNLPVSDTQCGLKGFNLKGKDVFLQTSINRYLFDLEFVFLLSKARHLKVVPIVVKLKPGVVFSKISLNILLKESINFLRLVMRMY